MEGAGKKRMSEVKVFDAPCSLHFVASDLVERITGAPSR